jgi:hypothetical protein
LFDISETSSRVKRNVETLKLIKTITLAPCEANVPASQNDDKSTARSRRSAVWGRPPFVKSFFLLFSSSRPNDRQERPKEKMKRRIVSAFH